MLSSKRWAPHTGQASINYWAKIYIRLIIEGIGHGAYLLLFSFLAQMGRNSRTIAVAKAMLAVDKEEQNRNGRSPAPFLVHHVFAHPYWFQSLYSACNLFNTSLSRPIRVHNCLGHVLVNDISSRLMFKR